MNRRSEAAERGAKTFESAKPCRKCAGLLRYTSGGQCVTCAKARAAADYQSIRTAMIAAGAAKGRHLA